MTTQEIDPAIVQQVKLRIDALSNLKRRTVLDFLIEKKEPYSAYMIAIKVRLPLSTVQHILNILVDCEFVEKVEHYKGAKYSVNIEEVNSFKRFLKIFKDRDWNS